MNEDKLIINKEQAFNKALYYRLVALWVLCEAMLGGIIHGLKLPVSGLFVGGAAVMVISLMAYYTPQKGSILKATIVVAIFKMMLSPQSPPPAYFAVFFQGLLAELVFFNSNFFKLSCFLLAVFSMIESAIQRILVLIILYGSSFWKAVDAFLSKLTNETSITSYSIYFAAGYITLHIIAGFFIGWVCSRIPAKVEVWKTSVILFQQHSTDKQEEPILKRKKRWLKPSLFIVWIVLIALYIQSVIPVGKPILPSNLILQIIIRSVLIVLSWWFLISPLITKWLQQILQKQQQKMPAFIQAITQLLPTIKSIVQQSWNNTQQLKGNKKMAAFIKIVTVNIIYGN